MGQRKKILPFLVHFIIIAMFFLCQNLYAEVQDEKLRYLLKLERELPGLEIPKENIYSRGDILFCTGGSEAAKNNNDAALLMEKGDYKTAAELFKQSLKRAPLFFPFRYNFGLCCIHLDQFKIALHNLEKAVYIFPEYHKSYIQIGYIFDRIDKPDMAIEYYRKALKKNPRAFEVFVLIGNLYFDRNQLEMAMKYYESSLKIIEDYPDALLGAAKIYFKRENYYKSLIIIKTIKLDKEYDKSLHYYYAECAYKLQDYITANDHYTQLLNYKNDKFFLTTAESLIRHKIDLCGRFIENR